MERQLNKVSMQRFREPLDRGFDILTNEHFHGRNGKAPVLPYPKEQPTPWQRSQIATGANANPDGQGINHANEAEAAMMGGSMGGLGGAFGGGFGVQFARGGRLVYCFWRGETHFSLRGKYVCLRQWSPHFGAQRPRRLGT